MAPHPTLTTLLTLALSLTTTTLASPTKSKLIEPVPPPGSGINIWLSTITPTFYGQPSDNFDFTMHGDDFDSTIEAAETLASIYPKADQNGDELMVAFLNATQGGTMNADEAKDRHWLCNELGPKMAPKTRACEGIKMTAWERVEL